jgi:hypothetical protein
MTIVLEQASGPQHHGVPDINLIVSYKYHIWSVVHA